MGNVGVASVLYEFALDTNNPPTGTILQHALSLQHLGLAEAAAGQCEAAQRTAPDNPIAGQFTLYALFFVADGVARHAQAARAWASRHEQRNDLPTVAVRPAEGRRLRIGYVAPSFTRGQLHQFIGPVIDLHDRAAYEVFLYPNAKEDTAPWRGAVSQRPLSGLSTDQATAQIRSDRIDVLVDAWGHASGNRMDVFMRRAAPVQVSWLNYQQTTGLSTMDHVLFADSVTAPNMDALFTESIWRMGATSAPFRPTHMDTPTPAPALRNAWTTFGSFINPAKLSDETIAAWSKILNGAPTARLYFKYRYFIDPLLRQTVIARFAAHGVESGRLFFSGASTGAEYTAAFGEIDLMLDTSPCPGGTTTLEAMSRGVPVLILSGDTHYGRSAIQIVAGAGMHDMIASSWDEYVAKATSLNANPRALQDLRDRTAIGFASAPYRDEAAVVRRLEAAYRQMFSRWAANQAR
jgi:predicted O-linked N-acetylglucosamine transferase (SPINDLY family)